MNNNRDEIELRLEALTFQKSPLECPSASLFAAFMEERLGSEEEDAIRNHLTQCQDCNMAYHAWVETEGIEGPPVPAKLLEAARNLPIPAVKRIVMKLLDKALQVMNPLDLCLKPMPEAGLGLTRKGAAQADDQYELVEINPDLPYLETIQIQHLAGKNAIKVRMIPSKSLKDEERQIRVDIYDEANLIQSWPIYDDGVSLNPLERGGYRLEVKEIMPGLENHQVKSLGAMDLVLE